MHRTEELIHGGGAARDRRRAVHPCHTGRQHRPAPCRAETRRRRDSGRGRRVGDQRDPVGSGRLDRRVHHRGVDVHAVRDQLDGHPRILQQRQRRSRLAMVQRPHRVEQMGADRGAQRDGVGGSARSWHRYAQAPQPLQRPPNGGSRRRLPGRSGASVTIRIAPSPAASSASISAGVGSRSWVWSCAPQCAALSHGPSRWMPATMPSRVDFGEHPHGRKQIGRRRGDQAGQRGGGAVPEVKRRPRAESLRRRRRCTSRRRRRGRGCRQSRARSPHRAGRRRR